MTAALGVIPADSAYATVVSEVMAFHDANPGDWRACYAWIHANHGYDKYPGRVHIIPNAAIMAMAMLYGQDDFIETLKIANMGGWDTDCNAGNVGAIMGTAVGLAGIDMRWRSQMNDLLVGASIVGAHNLTDLPACADLFATLGAQGQRPGGQHALHRFHGFLLV